MNEVPRATVSVLAPPLCQRGKFPVLSLERKTIQSAILTVLYSVQ